MDPSLAVGTGVGGTVPAHSGIVERSMPKIGIPQTYMLMMVMMRVVITSGIPASKQAERS